MSPALTAIALLLLLGFVSYKAARYFKQRRIGYAVGMLVLAVVIAYQIMATWYGAPPVEPPAGAGG